MKASLSLLHTHTYTQIYMIVRGKHIPTLLAFPLFALYDVMSLLITDVIKGKYKQTKINLTL